MGEHSPIRPAPALAAQDAPRPLALDPASCEGLSGKRLLSHWENNYIASVNALNLVERQLDDALASTFGTFANWEAEFCRTGLSFGGGYGAAAPKYVDAFMRNVDCREVEPRYVRALAAQA